MRGRPVFNGSLAIAIACLLTACSEDGPAKPSPVAASAVVSIQISGSDSITPGQSVQLVAIIRQADGTTKSVTSMPNLKWSTPNTSLVIVTSSGLVFPLDDLETSGEAVITAQLMDSLVQATHSISVNQAGTYRMVGAVHDADTPTLPLAGARVEVLQGFNFAITNDAGQYRLYGVPPKSTIRITAAGYETHDEQVDLTANVTRDFLLNIAAGASYSSSNNIQFRVTPR